MQEERGTASKLGHFMLSARPRRSQPSLNKARFAVHSYEVLIWKAGTRCFDADMLIALLSDIHGNADAMDASLAQAEALGAQRYVFLGDLVGYGAEPERVVRCIKEYMGRGAIALMGNHDSAVLGSTAGMNRVAAMALDWTRRTLSDGAKAFLSSLPLSHREDGLLFVHASADRPERWDYVLDAQAARASLAATDAAVTFCGHVHVPALYCVSEMGKLIAHTPSTNVAIPLGHHRRWLAVMGSVGQPRDGKPSASFAVYDSEEKTLTYRRAPYDVESAAAKIRAAGLPEMLAVRLSVGR
jgi:diadenosine tetraphosphatase ApaH/serine/threonine PP2A family protein phosphatase